MVPTPPRGTHRAPGPAVIDYRGLVAPVGRSVSGVAVGAVTAGVAISGLGAAHAQAPAAPSHRPATITAALPVVGASPATRSVSPATRTAPVLRTAPSVVTLRSGARGDSVRTLQRALNDRGASLRVDGVYGPATLQAVRDFQASSGLAVDGVAGRRTWSALGTAPAAREASSSSTGTPVLRSGARGDDVRTLQKKLREHGATMTADGVFGNRTDRAVRAFQSSVGLRADGVVGARTWRALNGSQGSAVPTASETTAAQGGSGTSRGSAATGRSIDGDSAVAAAAAQVGAPYAWGKSSPSTGFDCSGLTRYVYSSLGITLPRTAKAQALGGRVIPQSEARPGDLVAFTDEDYGHIGIYAGGNRIIDASGSRGVVTSRTIWSAPHVFVTYR